MKHSNDFYSLLQNSILNHDLLIEPYLQMPPKGVIADRINIYANGFYSRLEEVLLNDYPTLAAQLGQQAFSNLCRSYVIAYPSYSYSLNFLGQYLNRFLAETAPYSKKPYLAEIAAYEWAESQAFTAANATLLTVAELQILPASEWPDKKFYLHPSCHLLTMHWNSFSLLDARRRQSKNFPRPKKLTAPQALLVWRRELQVRYYQLDDVELALLTAVKKEASFMELCEHLSHVIREDDVASYIVKKMHIWLNEQIFIH